METTPSDVPSSTRRRLSGTTQHSAGMRKVRTSVEREHQPRACRHTRLLLTRSATAMTKPLMCASPPVLLVDTRCAGMPAHGSHRPRRSLRRLRCTSRRRRDAGEKCLKNMTKRRLGLFFPCRVRNCSLLRWSRHSQCHHDASVCTCTRRALESSATGDLCGAAGSASTVSERPFPFRRWTARDPKRQQQHHHSGAHRGLRAR